MQISSILQNHLMQVTKIFIFFFLLAKNYSGTGYGWLVVGGELVKWPQLHLRGELLGRFGRSKRCRSGDWWEEPGLVPNSLGLDT